MNNWMEFTRGPLGIPGIPPVLFFGHELSAKCEQLASSLSPLLGRGGEGLRRTRNLKRSTLGRILVAISEDEIFCQSLGKNVGLAKLQSFVLGAMLAAVPGALYEAVCGRGPELKALSSQRTPKLSFPIRTTIRQNLVFPRRIVCRKRTHRTHRLFAISALQSIRINQM